MIHTATLSTHSRGKAQWPKIADLWTSLDWITILKIFFSRPDPGCLQYHTGLTGRLTSFNFLPTTDNHLSNQKYVWKSVKFSSLNLIINFSWRLFLNPKLSCGKPSPSTLIHLEFEELLFGRLKLFNCWIKVSKNRLQIFQPKLLPKYEPTNLFFYADYSIVNHTVMLTTYQDRKKNRWFVFWKKFWLENLLSIFTELWQLF